MTTAFAFPAPCSRRSVSPGVKTRRAGMQARGSGSPCPGRSEEPSSETGSSGASAKRFALHRADFGPQWDIVINPRRAALTAPFAEIERALEKVIEKCAH